METNDNITEGIENTTHYDIFVSYSTRDKVFADALVNRMESAGYRCWYAPRDIPAGMTWPAAITQAVRQSTAMLLIFSESSNSSPEVSKELTLASNNKRLVIPVRIDNSNPSEEIEYHLTNKHWLDVFDLELENAVTSVMNNLKTYEELFKVGREGLPEVQDHKGFKKSRALSYKKWLVAIIAVALITIYFGFIKEPAIPELAFNNLGHIGSREVDYNAPRPEIGKYSMAYMGGQGIIVWLVRFGPEANKEYLVMARGLDNPWDNYVIRTVEDRTGSWNRYSALLKGEPAKIFMVKGDKAILFPPGTDQKIELQYNKEMSDSYYSDFFLTQYLYQKKEEDVLE